MSQSPRDRANAMQRLASDPAVSAFVSASAGSGKTKLLTDRLLRLMLSGADPGRIQCLTFTKAAAAEMALRLQRRLGDWVTTDDVALDKALRSLDVEPSAAVRARARSLFAVVLDLPGGMRIGTIHAFCQSLLRRFPLEAAISPHFQLIEERDAGEARRAAREDVLARSGKLALNDPLRHLAGLVKADEFGEIAAALATERERLDRALALGPDLAEAQRRILGVTRRTEADIMTAAADWPESQRLRDAARRVAASSKASPGCKERANGILDWLAHEPSRRSARWQAWAEYFLKANGDPFSPEKFVNKNLHAECPDLQQAFLDEAARIRRVDDERRAVKTAAASAALVGLAQPVIESYARRKDEGGLVDYDDLIGRTSRLLVDPGAAWVLYKLDGGLDHLLLDEVQDTAPAQWRIAHALTMEFFAGEGGRDGPPRTVFAVGDRKQSIFSFQGADIAAFDESRQRLGRAVVGAGLRWVDTTLNVSFRSTAPVLDLVDRVFAHPIARRGVVGSGDLLEHFADRAAHAGSVELWPLAPLPERTDSPPWAVLDDYLKQTSAQNLLAEELATWIAGQTAGDVMLEGRGRPLAPGDVMVLVRKRGKNGAFPRALMRALKARGVPVAGLDRLTLTEQPAVQDLVALCNVLLLPEDDLSLACLLTSPLGGLDDQDLMTLAVGRETSLWERLRTRHQERPAWAECHELVARLLARADYVTPHALLAEALGPLRCRAKLLARLGAEAAEPIDELLQVAIAYGRTHPPLLQGFLHWLAGGGTEVRREPEGAGNAVRIMTVHGAKGLQAPVVILPDTTSVPEDRSGLFWAADAVTGTDVPLWVPRKEFRCEAAERIRAAERERQMEEYNRLLYVALTRAEDKLLICGWELAQRQVQPESWYRQVETAFSAGDRTETPHTWGTRLRFASPQEAAPVRDAGERPPPAEPLPAWAGHAPLWRASPPPTEPSRPEPLAPSRPEGALLGAVPSAASPIADRVGSQARFRRGQLIHALLQHLPSLPDSRWESAASCWLARPGSGVRPDEVAALVQETLAILRHSDLVPLFGPGSRAEVPLTGLVDGVVIGGLVDRLAVLPDRVLIADYKTSRGPPDIAGRTPVLYLRQMAAYRGVLRAVFPTRAVACALIWTQGATVMGLPDALLDAHAPGTAAQTGLQGVLA